MKANRLLFTLLLLSSAAVFQLPAQKTAADKQMVEEVIAKAKSGDADSEFKLGVRYYWGTGVVKDHVEAVKWYRKAAEQNLVNAQLSLGICYEDGEGVTKDYVEAVKWYRKAAEQNLAEAQFGLGVCYTIGKGVVKDSAEAVTWFRKAAEQNYAEAQYILGLSYAKGEGVAKNAVEAYTWWLLAARQGNEDAKKDIAMLENQMTPEQIAQGQGQARNFKPRRAIRTKQY